MRANIILFVSDQEASARFYEAVLMMRPSLNVPGMTEFKLNEGLYWGLCRWLASDPPGHGAP